MSDCLNEEMRDLLPILAHGSLPAAEAARVRAHADECGACGSELALLETSRLVLHASAPLVDMARITRAVNLATANSTANSTASAPSLRVERGGSAAPATPLLARRPIWRSRQVLAAAASLLIVASLSIRLLDRTPSSDESVATLDTSAVVTDLPATNANTDGGLSVGDVIGDLSSDDLSTLLDELERVDATITLEPATLRQPTVDVPETL